jgi:hypothetical protein
MRQQITLSVISRLSVPFLAYWKIAYTYLLGRWTVTTLAWIAVRFLTDQHRSVNAVGSLLPSLFCVTTAVRKHWNPGFVLIAIACFP